MAEYFRPSATQMKQEILPRKLEGKFKSFLSRNRIKHPRAATQNYYSPGQMPAAYGMPIGIDVTPQTIVIFELGGAPPSAADVAAWAVAAKMPAPTITTYLLPGADNSSSDADAEVALDRTSGRHRGAGAAQSRRSAHRPGPLMTKLLRRRRTPSALPAATTIRATVTPRRPWIIRRRARTSPAAAERHSRLAASSPCGTTATVKERVAVSRSCTLNHRGSRPTARARDAWFLTWR
jgi:hypothetical protein